MADQTTTPEDQDTEALDESQEQPEDQDQKGAGDQADDSNQPDDKSDEGSKEEETKDDDQKSEDASKDEQPSDDEIKAWADKKGLPLDDPIKLAKAYREAEKKLHDSGKQVSELRKQTVKDAEEGLDDDTDPQSKEAVKLLNQLAVTDFYLNNPEARQFDGSMAEILKEKPHLLGDYETLLSLARSRTSEEALAEARKQGEKSALKSTNQAQRSGSPEMSAASQTTGGDKEDPFEKAFDAEFEK